MIRALGWILALSLASTRVPAEDLWADRGSCNGLLRDQALDGVAEQAEQAASRAALLAAGGPAWTDEEEAAETIEDLETILSQLHSFRSGSLAELHGFSGDVFLATGRLTLAIDAYRRANREQPGAGGRCGSVHGGQVYTLEIIEGYSTHFTEGHSTHYRSLSSYVLRRDANTGLVLERTLLPAVPVALTSAGDALLVSLWRDRGTLRLEQGRLAYPLWVPDDLLARLRLPRLRSALVYNFTFDQEGKASPSFAPRHDGLEGIPTDLGELEAALRHAIFLDSTQPWHLFFLGQCLWSQDRRDEATTAWRKLLAGDGFPAIPYYEFMAMAWTFEHYQQTAWADAAYREALARRRGLPLSVDVGNAIQRLFNVLIALRRLEPEQWPKPDVERAYLWWLRLREISGSSEFDGFFAALWVYYFQDVGDTEREAAEEAYLGRVRQHPWTLVATGADYALWLQVASLVGILCLVLALAVILIRQACSFRMGVVLLVASSLAAWVAFSTPEGSASRSLFSVLAKVLIGPLLILILCRVLMLCRIDWRQTRTTILRLSAVGFVSLLIFVASHFAHLFVLYHLDSSDFGYNSDTLEWVASVSQDATEQERLRVALGSHVTGDFERARRLYQSLPETSQIRRNLSALERGLPPFSTGSLPLLSFGDVTTTGYGEWLLATFWPPARGLHFLIFNYYPDKEFRSRMSLARFRKPAKGGVPDHLSMNEVLQLSGFSLEHVVPFLVVVVLLALPQSPIRKWRDRLLLVLIPGTVFLRRGQPIRAYLVLWLFLFALGPLLWLVLSKSSSVFASHPYAPDFGLICPGPILAGTMNLTGEQIAFLPPHYDQLLAENFWSLLWVYPYSRSFYSLVALALMVALYLHGRGVISVVRRRNRSRACSVAP